MNVVLFDERGVRRSDAIDTENFDFQILLDDMEEIRTALHIKKWSVLGHSFGGLLAFLYAVKYQENVETLILECPTFHYKDSSDYTNQAIIKKLNEHGLYGLAAEITSVMESENPYSGHIFDAIPEHVVTEIYHPFPRNKKASEMSFKNGITDEENEKTKRHCALVMNDIYANENHLPKLKNLYISSLLLIGEHDIVCSPHQQAVFARDVAKGKIIVLPNCGHTLHGEIPVVFVDTVLGFMLQ